MKLRQLSGATVLRLETQVKQKSSAPSGLLPRAGEIPLETLRPPGFNEPPPYDGYYVERLAETPKTRLYRRVDRRAFYVVHNRTGVTREISKAAATINLLRIDGSITAGEFRLLLEIFRISSKEVAA